MRVTISCAGEHLLEAGLLHVEDLALQRKDGLVAAVAALLGRARRRSLPRRCRARSRTGPCSWQSASLPGKSKPVQGALAAHGLARLACGDAARGWRRRPWRRFSWRTGVLVRGNCRGFSFTICSTRPLISELPSLVLVCPSNWGLGSFTADHRRQPLAGVLAGGRFLQVLPHAAAVGVGVDGAGERALEARPGGFRPRGC